MKILRRIIKIFLIILIVITTLSLTFCISLLFGSVNINKLKKEFEKMPNVKVLDIWAHGDFDEYADAILLIDNKHFLRFKYFTKDSFIDNKGIVRIDRIDNWNLWVNEYGFLNVYEIKSGQPVKSNGATPGIEFTEFKIFIKRNGLPDIKKIQDVINNFDQIIAVIDKIPEYSNDIKNWDLYIMDNMSVEQRELVKYYDPENDMTYWLKKTNKEWFVYEENMDMKNYRYK